VSEDADLRPFVFYEFQSACLSQHRASEIRIVTPSRDLTATALIVRSSRCSRLRSFFRCVESETINCFASFQSQRPVASTAARPPTNFH